MQVAAGFCTSDGETGMFQLRGSLQHPLLTDTEETPEDAFKVLSVSEAAEAQGIRSLASTAGSAADIEQDLEACTDAKEVSIDAAKS